MVAINICILGGILLLFICNEIALWSLFLLWCDSKSIQIISEDDSSSATRLASDDNVW